MTDKLQQAKEVEATIQGKMELVELAGALVVDSEEAAEAAAQLVRDLRAAKAFVVDELDPVREATYSAYQIALGNLKKYRDPLDEAATKLGELLSSYNAEKRRLAASSRQKLVSMCERAVTRLEASDEERAAVMERVEHLLSRGVDDEDDLVGAVTTGLQKFRREKKEAAAKVEAAEEEAGGFDNLLDVADELDALEEVELEVAAAVPEAAPEEAAGTHEREKWSVEVKDLRALCAAVSKGTLPESFVEPNLPTIRRAMLNVEAGQRAEIRWPGVSVGSKSRTVVESDTS